ncbi:PREDICTED: endomucin-like, partial [Galeopterus variegatus]|uniref:Endomucin-like n=1 Tax=Galeopterus variegatus TaxID=482537 RepID=A0ABM0SDV5_GALVR
MGPKALLMIFAGAHEDALSLRILFPWKTSFELQNHHSSLESRDLHGSVTNTSSVSPSSIPTTKTFVTTPNTTSLPILVTKATAETSPKGTANSKLLETSLTPTTPPLTTAKEEELGTKTNGVMKNESITTNTTVTNLPPPNAVSTIQSPQNKTENQSSINTTKRL